MIQNINKFRNVRIAKWILYYILRPFFRFENILYTKYTKLNKQKKINRLFCTTGNISLINALAIIKEIGNEDKYNDFLVFDTGKGAVEFYNKQLELASVHKFKKIIKEIHLNVAVQTVIHNLFYIDEVYMLNHPLFLKDVPHLFKNAPVTLIDEGAASLINYGCENIPNIVKFKTHKYLQKLDFIGLDTKSSGIKFEYIDNEKFREVSAILADKSPILYDNKPEEKYIMYCGVYWEVSGLDRGTFVKIQSDMLNKLLECGYKILYKPHPRDNEFFGFDTNPDVQFIDSKYPIELYNLDIVALVSVSSTASITYAHYWNVPSFSNVIAEAIENKDCSPNKLDLVRNMVKEYSPDYKELLEIDVKNLTKEEVKKQIKERYLKFINSKPLLSENKEIKKYEDLLK